MFKKLKIKSKKRERKKGKLPRTAKAQCRGRVHNNNKKCDREKKKKILKTLIRFPSANKEKELATDYSTFAWKLPWMEDPDRLQSMGSLRVGQD